jgi:asparagine synthase (glutamine-hydrolysing)
VLTVAAGAAPSLRRYWRWRDLGGRHAPSEAAAIEEVHACWKTAVRRRLAGARRPGQTLSGGLDSRALLAEAAPRSPSWTAITYGVPGCDDARYALAAAQAAGAAWTFLPLYRDGWLDERARRIQDTDGLVELVDLCHLESLALQAERIDVHLSGYIGDAVVGGTFNRVGDARDVLAALPWYGPGLGLDEPEALARAEALLADLDGAPARFALFEHKLPQSTNRWSAAWRPWLRVRKPFVDYAFFDLCQGLPPALRDGDRLRRRWLVSRYPACFRRIPDQKTGLPPLAPGWRLELERARRFAWRALQPPLARLGLPAEPRRRAFRDEERHLRTPDVRARIEALLGPASLCAGILGRAPLARALAAFFDGAGAPVQVVGALFAFESYHRGLAAHLRAARTG